MQQPIRIAICQIRHVVGDIAGNAARIVDAVDSAHRAGADLALLPECSVSGYPAEDLWLDDSFTAASEHAMTWIAEHCAIPALVGGPRRVGDATRNACAMVRNGEVEAWYDKQCLPNYGVFDEARWFSAGGAPLIVDVAGVRVGVSICEDIWVDGAVAELYPQGSIDVLVNLSASPFHLRRAAEREQLVAKRARELGAAVVLCNRVGGQDELVFDGGSVAAAADGTIIARCMQFAEDVHVVECGGPTAGKPSGEWLTADEELWGALQLGLRDYVDTNGFGDVVVGVSGGIDSALVATLAVDALGADRVHAVTLPSQITSSETLEDARSLAARLGISLDHIAIEPVMETYLDAIDVVIDGPRQGLMEENLQARIRGTLLMALSNQFGWLVLTTGNKSETAVGYSTLYGDTAGGFAPIKDIAKTRVWELARWRNAQAERAGVEVPIPPSTIERPPTAELRHGQLDEDSLPPYEELDQILSLHVEQRASLEAIVEAGFDRETVSRVIGLVRVAEYKRRQSPPGIRVTPLAFGRERRMPITNMWRGGTPALAT